MDQAANPIQLGSLIHDVSRMRRTMMDHYLRPIGFTRSQWAVMNVLLGAGDGGLMQADLARLLEVGKVTVGGLVDRLEASGHVARRPDPGGDRRIKRVVITDQGHARIEQLFAAAERLDRGMMRGIAVEDMEVAEKVLGHLKSNIREAMKAKP